MTVPDPLTVLDCHLLQQLGERLRRRRKASGASMVEMAGRAGISRMTLGAVEAGDPSATMGSYLRVMAVLGLSGEMARVASDVLPPAAAPPDGIRSRRVRPAAQVIISADETRHQIQDQQSLALHRQAVRAVKQDPALLDQAITTLERWLAATPDSRSASLWHEWGQILKDRSWRKILSSNQQGQQLRQASPLVTVLSKEVRLEVLSQIKTLKGGVQLGNQSGRANV